MKNNIQQLYRVLKKEGHLKEAAMVRYLYIMAGYDEEWRNRIDNLSRGKDYYFKSWFPEGKDRVVIDFIRTDIDMPDKIEEVIKEFKINFSDYLGGYVTDEHGRSLKFSRVISKLMKRIDKALKNPELSKEDREVMEKQLGDLDAAWEAFRTDLQRTSKEAKMAVVISQSPHDIAQSSFNRNWDSCFRIGPDDEHSDAGAHAQSTFCEVERGGLVAYLIKQNDQDIKDPMARILIRRFTNKDGQSVAIAEDSVYGDDVPGFQEAVNKWLQQNNTIIPPGRYERQGGTYSDTFGDDMDHYIAPEELEEIVKWLNRDISEEVKTSTWTVHDHHYEDLGEAGFWNYNDPFKDEITFEDNDYNGWGESYEEWEGASNGGSMTFKTEEEADQFLGTLKHYGDWETYTKSMLIESEGLDSYEIDDMDPDEFSEKYEEFIEDRFSIERNDQNNTSSYQSAAMRKALTIVDQLDEETLDIMEEFVDEEYVGNNRWYKGRKKFYFTVPNRLTPEEFVDMGAYVAGNMLKGKKTNLMGEGDIPGQVSDEKRQEFINAATIHLNEYLNISSKKAMSEIYKTDSRQTHLTRQEQVSERYAMNLVMMANNKANYFDKLYPEVELIMHRFFDEIEAESKILQDKDKHQVYLTILDKIVSISDFKDLEAIAKILKRVMAFYNPDSFGRGITNTINLNSIGYSTSLLGANPELAKDFFPIFQKQLKNIKTHAMVYAEHKASYNMEIKEQIYNKTLEDAIEMLNYVIDSLTNGKGRSERYKWF